MALSVRSYVDLGLEAITAPRMSLVASTGAMEARAPTSWGWVVGGIGAVLAVVGVAASMREDQELERLSRLPEAEIRTLLGSESEERRKARAAFEGRGVRTRKAPWESAEDVAARAAEALAAEDKVQKVLAIKAERKKSHLEAVEAGKKKWAAKKAAADKRKAQELTRTLEAHAKREEEWVEGTESPTERRERAARAATAAAAKEYAEKRAEYDAEVQKQRTLVEEQYPWCVDTLGFDRLSDPRTQDELRHLASRSRARDATAEEKETGAVAERLLRLESGLRKLLKSAARKATYGRVETFEDPIADREIQDLVVQAMRAEAAGDLEAARGYRAEAMKQAIPYVEEARKVAEKVGKRHGELAEEYATEASLEAMYSLVAPGVCETQVRPSAEAAACWKGGRVGQAIVAEARAIMAYKGVDPTRSKGMQAPRHRCDFEEAQAAADEALRQGEEPYEEGKFNVQAAIDARHVASAQALKELGTRAKARAAALMRQEWEKAQTERDEQRVLADLERRKLAVDLYMLAVTEDLDAAGVSRASGWRPPGERKGPPVGVDPPKAARCVNEGKALLEAEGTEAAKTQVAAESARIAEAKQRALLALKPTVHERAVREQALLPVHQRKTPLELRAPLVAAVARRGRCKRAGGRR